MTRLLSIMYPFPTLTTQTSYRIDDENERKQANNEKKIIPGESREKEKSIQRPYVRTTFTTAKSD